MTHGRSTRLGNRWRGSGGIQEKAPSFEWFTRGETTLLREDEQFVPAMAVAAL